MDQFFKSVIRRFAKARIVNDCPCPLPCAEPVHAPGFVFAAGLSCTGYFTWLRREAGSLRARDEGWHGRPARPAYMVAVHTAVEQTRGYDFYTALPLEWKLLAQPRQPTQGRAEHVMAGRQPSVDHIDGKRNLDFRICASNVNHAKGPLSYRAFVEMCEAVAECHGNGAGSRTRSGPGNRHDLSQPHRNWWRCFTWWRFTQPMKARCQSAGVRS